MAENQSYKYYCTFSAKYIPQEEDVSESELLASWDAFSPRHSSLIQVVAIQNAGRNIPHYHLQHKLSKGKQSDPMW